MQKDRSDPWVKGKSRELMVSVWYPSLPGGECKPAMYLQPAAAAHFSQSINPAVGIGPDQIDWTNVDTHACTGANVKTQAGERPVVLYSPGFAVSRQFGTVLFEELVSADMSLSR